MGRGKLFLSGLKQSTNSSITTLIGSTIFETLIFYIVAESMGILGKVSTEVEYLNHFLLFIIITIFITIFLPSIYQLNQNEQFYNRVDALKYDENGYRGYLSGIVTGKAIKILLVFSLITTIFTLQNLDFNHLSFSNNKVVEEKFLISNLISLFIFSIGSIFIQFGFYLRSYSLLKGSIFQTFLTIITVSIYFLVKRLVIFGSYIDFIVGERLDYPNIIMAGEILLWFAFLILGSIFLNRSAEKNRVRLSLISNYF